MPSLKDLKNRIESVKNTRKITKAMQMVAAAKLMRAQIRQKLLGLIQKDLMLFWVPWHRQMLRAQAVLNY